MALQQKVAIAAACVVIIGATKQKKKIIWVRPYLQTRNGQIKLINDQKKDELKLHIGELRSIDSFKNFRRMSQQ